MIKMGRHQMDSPLENLSIKGLAEGTGAETGAESNGLILDLGAT